MGRRIPPLWGVQGREVMAKGEPSRAEPGLSFHEAVGMNTAGQEARAFENALFSQNTGVMD